MTKRAKKFILKRRKQEARALLRYEIKQWVKNNGAHLLTALMVLLFAYFLPKLITVFWFMFCRFKIEC